MWAVFAYQRWSVARSRRLVGQGVSDRNIDLRFCGWAEAHAQRGLLTRRGVVRLGAQGLGLLSLVSLAGRAAAAQADKPNAGNNGGDSTIQASPDTQHLLEIEASINSKGPFHFVVDT